MKRKLRISLVMIAALATAHAQNLVPNPGFESMKKMPATYMQSDIENYIYDWHQGGSGSSDICCDTLPRNNPVSTCTGSSSAFGEQKAHGGNNMCMIRTMGVGSFDYREYIGVSLTRPLTVGEKYSFEMYVSACDKNNCFSNNLGVLFRTGQYQVSTQTIITGEPQVNHTTVIRNTTEWVKVSGSFVADQAYTWLVIGNFFTQDKTVFEGKENRSPAGTACYYVDDVSVKSPHNLWVTGDTLVMSGATATVVARGGTTYKWVDIRAPKVVLGTEAELKVPVEKPTTFRVYSEDDTAEITVRIKKFEPVYQTELNGRKVRKGRTLVVHNDEITVSVHDKNEVDGDSVSLYYGDSLIVEHLALTKKKQSYTIKVDKNYPRQIILYAENLGSTPPNTAELTIKDGKESTDIVLGSDFKWCDSIMLLYKEEK